MAGDEITATTQYYYQNSVTNTTGNNLTNDVLATLISSIQGSAITGLAKGNATNISNELGLDGAFTNITSPDANNSAGSSPKAYMTIMFFDERFNYISEGSTSLRVNQQGDNASPLVASNIKAPKNGYVYVYLSNESNEAVYFDNFRVNDNRGRIIEEDHYYSFGLKIAGISSAKLGDGNEGLLENKNLYNDKELFEDADLDWYDYGFRNYDPQIGRFVQLDPLTNDYPHYTPYQYAGNEPIANVDIDGLEELPTIYVTGYKTTQTARAALNAARIITWTGETFYNYVNSSGENFRTYTNLGSTTQWNGQQWKSNGTGQDIYSGREPAIKEEEQFKGFDWPNYSKADGKRWDGYSAMLRDRHNNGEPLVQNNDPDDYQRNFDFYERSWKADQDWRSTQYYLLDFATLFIPTPKVGMLRWLKPFGNSVGRVFWSGGGVEGRVFAEASNYAFLSGGTTLEKTLMGRTITGLQTLTGRNKMTGALWKWASTKFASGAVGEVNVFLAPNLRENAFWYTEKILFRIK